MTHLSKDWENINKKLDKASSKYEDFIKNEDFKQFVVWPVNINSYVMHNEIILMLSLVDIVNDDILEVGGCFGNFCRCLHDRIKIKSYTILDTKSMLRFSKSFLDHYDIKCDFVSDEDYKSLFNKKFGLLMANVCLSEMPREYSDDLLDNVLPNCNAVFVIDSKKEEIADWIEEKIRKNFTYVCFSDIPDELSTQKKHRVYSGAKTYTGENSRLRLNLALEVERQHAQNFETLP